MFGFQTLSNYHLEATDRKRHRTSHLQCVEQIIFLTNEKLGLALYLLVVKLFNTSLIYYIYYDNYIIYV